MTGPQDRGQDPSPTAAAAGPTYDAFLSHNGADKAAVADIARRLRDAGLDPFLDAWHLIPGEPWQEALEEALDASRTCVVFVGPAGFGPWENEEMRAALSRRVANPEFRVIPAILPGAVLPDRGRLPRFLSRLTWVDFRPGLDDPAAFDRLVDGIRGFAPDAVDEADAAETPIVCPFRGLEVFDEEHAAYFFGREALTQYLVEQLRSDRFLAVVGPSGSGKSSVVRAGLVPHLRAGELPGSAGWPVVLVRPGPHPLESLASRVAAVLMPGSDVLASRQSVLAELKDGERGLHAVVQTIASGEHADERVLVVVDQFEEVFTLCHDEAERVAFVDALLHASGVVGGQTIVVLTMRADFFGRCAALPVLAARLAERDVLVPPMEEDDLRRTIVQPAELAGLQFEKGLVDTILDDLGSEPGSLPLLEHTLLELFEGRRGRWLTIDRYHEIGGVRGAIAQRAEAVFANLTPEQQAAARRVLLRLTQPGEGTEDTRRRASVTELLPTCSTPGAVEAVVDQLADARLLVTSETDTGEEIVDVAHEALIRGWPRLQGWINENPAGLRIHRRITDTATEWEASKRDPSYLFTGQRLVDAFRWRDENEDDLNDIERAFLVASDAARQAERSARRRRTRVAIAGTATAMLLISAAAIVALVNWRAADTARVQAELAGAETEAARTELAGRLLASEGQRVAADEPLLGLRLEVEGLALVTNRPAAAAAIRSTVLAQLATGRTDALGQGVRWVKVSADGHYAVSVTDDGGAIWRLTDRTRISDLPSGICEAEFPNEERVGIVLLSYGDDCVAGNPALELRRLVDGTVLDGPRPGGPWQYTLVPPGSVLTYEPGALALRAVVDGRVLATGTSVLPLQGANRALVEPTPGHWQLVDATTGGMVQDLGDFPEAVESSGSGAAFALRDDEGRCTVWESDFGRKLADGLLCGTMTVSPDGSVMAIWTDAGVELRDTTSGMRLADLGSGVSRVDFSPAPGAPTLVASRPDKPPLLVRTKDGAVITRYQGLLSAIRDVSAEGQKPGVVTYSNDGRLVFVRVDTPVAASVKETTSLRVAETGEHLNPEPPTDPFSGPGRPWEVTFSPDPGSDFARVEFTGGRSALYRTSNLARVDTAGDTLSVTFVPPPVGLVLLGHTDHRVSVLDWEGVTIAELPGNFRPVVTAIADTAPQLLLLTFEAVESLEQRRPILLDITGEWTQLDSEQPMVVSPGGAWYVNGNAVWSRLPTPARLLTLPRSTSGWAFSGDGGRLILTEEANGTAHLIDMAWLESVSQARPDALTNERLIELVCGGPAGTLVDDVALRTSMKDVAPSACD